MLANRTSVTVVLELASTSTGAVSAGRSESGRTWKLVRTGWSVVVLVQILAQVEVVLAPPVLPGVLLLARVLVLCTSTEGPKVTLNLWGI